MIIERKKIQNYVWFSQSPSFSLNTSFLYSPVNFNLPVVHKQAFYLDRKMLNCSEEELFLSFNSTCRNEILKAKTLEIDCVEISQKIALDFLSHHLAKSKFSLPSKSSLESLSGNLIFRAAKFEGRIKSVHIYLVDRHNRAVFLWRSVSDFRSQEPPNARQFSGLVHRYLHYMDMLFFKMSGIVLYDFGATLKKDRNNIRNHFKRSFNPSQLVVYHYIPYHIYFLKNLIRWIRHISSKKTNRLIATFYTRKKSSQSFTILTGGTMFQE